MNMPKGEEEEEEEGKGVVAVVKKMGKKCFYTAVCPLLQLEKEGKG